MVTRSTWPRHLLSANVSAGRAIERPTGAGWVKPRAAAATTALASLGYHLSPPTPVDLAPSSSPGLAKTCVSVSQTGAPALATMGESSLVPKEVYQDSSIPWKEVKIFHGSRYRKIRFKEVSHLLWQRGGRRRLLRLFVLAPTPYRKTKEGRRYYRQKAYLLCDDNKLAAKELLQAYFDRWQIEINHRDEKSILGVGHAQVWAALSTPRVPALMVATYSLMLLSALETYGPKRTTAYEPLPKWRRSARRPSCLDLVTLVRKQIEAQSLCQGSPTNILGYPSMVQTAAA